MNDTMRVVIGLTLIVVTHIALVFNGFTEISGDGFFKALMAYEWRMSPAIVSRDFGVFSLFWFPPYFWFTGIIYWLSNELVLTLKLTSYIASITGLLVLYRLSCQLTHKRAALLTVLLVGSIPFHLWLSLSMTETTLYLLTVLLGFQCFLKWLKFQKNLSLIGGSLAFLCCSALRPEGWVLACLFSLFILFLGFKQRGTNRFLLVVCALFPLLFIGFWLTDNWIFYGDPLHFLTAQKSHMDSKTYSATLKWGRSLQPLFFMFVLSPLLFLLIATGIMAKWRSFGSEIRGYLTFVILYVVSLAVLFQFGFGTTASPQRYGLIPVVLLAPFAGFLLSNYLEKTPKLIGLSVLALILCFHLIKGLTPQNRYKDAIELANFISKKPEMSGRPAFKHFSTEFELRYLSKQLPESQRDYLTLSTEHGAILAYSERPDDFLTRPLQAGTGPLPESQMFIGEIATNLKKKNIDTVLIRDRELMESLPSDYRLVRTFGRYSIMSIYDDPNWDQPENSMETGSDVLIVPGIRLAGYHYEGDIYPVTLKLSWNFEGPTDPECRYRLWVKATRQGVEDETIIWNFRPIFCWYDSDKLVPHNTIEGSVPLDLPEEFSGGTYNISIALIQTTTSGNVSVSSSAEEIPWRELDPVQLAFSKRKVLMDHLKNRNPDWPLLFHILYKL